ncbi:MAG: two pore domain potassium channel family protein [Gammaproteobacteria bacterium]|nr:two pore domain potassium channel family protein [Gammaproteobacteria bacterium]MBQ0840766.1 two pore domain potassium channel family protein [Gammaproteobacteria bacterium]
MEITFLFIHIFLIATYLLTPLLAFLVVLVIVLGQVVGRIENWSKFNAFYWSFITALTVGYGDLRPSRHSTKLLSILIATLGIMFTGVIVGITVAAASNALNSVVDVKAVIRESISK